MLNPKDGMISRDTRENIRDDESFVLNCADTYEREGNEYAL